MPQMRMEAGGAEVLGICHRQRPKQVSGRRVCAFRWRLTALIGEQAASSCVDVGPPLQGSRVEMDWPA